MKGMTLMQSLATLMSTAAGSSAQQPVATDGNGSRLLNEHEVANLLRVHPQTIRNWRVAGTGPRSFRLGLRKIVYKLEDVAAWMDTQRYVPEPAEA
jgi:predicted DNA-binding transcriptional regulator AlpA